ncbi:MAG TPA: nitroreductase family protein [Actinomycetes bacterium]|nr:nitroreductase family protein [Actinomycetes bacterium]
METWDAIRGRRNVRQYADRPIDPRDLDRILEAGRRSPSASNRQRWDFVVCTDLRQLQELSKVWRGAGHVARSAATIVLLAPDTGDPHARGSIFYDLGQVTISMMLAAADLGIGSGHASVGDQDLARQILGHPEDRRCAYMIALGYPVDRPLAPLRAPDRRPFDDVVHRDRW